MIVYLYVFVIANNTVPRRVHAHHSIQIPFYASTLYRSLTSALLPGMQLQRSE